MIQHISSQNHFIRIGFADRPDADQNSISNVDVHKE